MSQENRERPRTKLKTLDELFLLDKEYEEQDALARKPVTPNTVPINELIPFSNHPFRLYDGERLDDMVESIKKNGILVPIIVRTTENGRFEILSGHNRVNAAKLAGFDKVPTIIKENLDDDKALIYVIETNLIQRSFSDMRHSEKAAVLTMQHSQMFSQGKRNDILCEHETLSKPHDINENPTSSLIAKKLTTIEKVGNDYGLSKDTVARYLRIDQLEQPLKDMLDNGKLGFYPAVSLSFLKSNEQNMVSKCLELNAFKADIKKSDLLRSYSENGKLDEDKIYLILNGELDRKPKTKATVFKLRQKRFAEFFSPSMKNREVEEIIYKACVLYFRQQNHESVHVPESISDTCDIHDEEMEM